MAVPLKLVCNVRATHLSVSDRFLGREQNNLQEAPDDETACGTESSQVDIRHGLGRVVDRGDVRPAVSGIQSRLQEPDSPHRPGHDGEDDRSQKSGTSDRTNNRLTGYELDLTARLRYGDRRVRSLLRD